MLVWLFYIIGFIILFGIMLGLIWWAKWIIAVGYIMIPTMGILYTAYAILFALPVSLLFDGTKFEQSVVKFSHAFSGFFWDIFWFGCTAPFKAIGLIIDILHWCMN